MYGRTKTCTLEGLHGHLVEVETDLTRGLPKMTIVGLPDTAIKESGERVRSAIKNSGYEYPMNRMTINLFPANLRKDGTQMDLAILISILAATGTVIDEAYQQFVYLGELQLNGAIGGVLGALPMVISLREQGFSKFIVPRENGEECAVVGDVDIFAVETVGELVDFLNGKTTLSPVLPQPIDEGPRQYALDMKDIKGQGPVKRVLEIAAAGGHNLLMIGPPGSGKSMSAKRLPSILPSMSFEEAIEVTKIYSVTGLLRGTGLVTQRPFREPHHTASAVALIGGGTIPKPGEISLAHNGVLFLDELPEFSQRVLEVLRQPMEERTIHIARANASLEYPANFQLIGAMNPCPCGHFGSQNHECTCSMQQIQRYLGRISRPLLDRMDLHIEVQPVAYEEIREKKDEVSSTEIRQRVERARQIQRERYRELKFETNAALPDKFLEKYCALDAPSQKLMELAFQRYKFSGRTLGKLLKIARTIADLKGEEAIGQDDLLEAIRYRSIEGKYWGKS
ncbi:MAG: YifB family Mg chelatase-like AAA ATPase [Tissierellia bacterium]|nr:YifB family Mg chelatase-like AAA ATPase [Tissierellia bacterium]